MPLGGLHGLSRGSDKPLRAHMGHSEVYLGHLEVCMGHSEVHKGHSNVHKITQRFIWALGGLYRPLGGSYGLI